MADDVVTAEPVDVDGNATGGSGSGGDGAGSGSGGTGSSSGGDGSSSSGSGGGSTGGDTGSAGAENEGSDAGSDGGSDGGGGGSNSSATGTGGSNGGSGAPPAAPTTEVVIVGTPETRAEIRRLRSAGEITEQSTVDARQTDRARSDRDADRLFSATVVDVNSRAFRQAMRARASGIRRRNPGKSAVFSGRRQLEGQREAFGAFARPGERRRARNQRHGQRAGSTLRRWRPVRLDPDRPIRMVILPERLPRKGEQRGQTLKRYRQAILHYKLLAERDGEQLLLLMPERLRRDVHELNLRRIAPGAMVRFYGSKRASSSNGLTLPTSAQITQAEAEARQQMTERAKLSDVYRLLSEERRRLLAAPESDEARARLREVDLGLKRIRGFLSLNEGASPGAAQRTIANVPGFIELSDVGSNGAVTARSDETSTAGGESAGGSIVIRAPGAAVDLYGTDTSGAGGSGSGGNGGAVGRSADVVVNGSAEDLRREVDQARACGMGVVLAENEQDTKNARQEAINAQGRKLTGVTPEATSDADDANAVSLQSDEVANVNVPEDDPESVHTSKTADLSTESEPIEEDVLLSPGDTVREALPGSGRKDPVSRSVEPSTVASREHPEKSDGKKAAPHGVSTGPEQQAEPVDKATNELIPKGPQEKPSPALQRPATVEDSQVNAEDESQPGAESDEGSVNPVAETDESKEPAAADAEAEAQSPRDDEGRRRGNREQATTEASADPETGEPTDPEPIKATKQLADGSTEPGATGNAGKIRMNVPNARAGDVPGLRPPTLDWNGAQELAATTQPVSVSGPPSRSAQSNPQAPKVLAR